MRTSHITGWGAYVPPKIVTNAELSEKVKTSDGWIRSHTGIRERRVMGPEEGTASMGSRSARRALVDAALEPESLDAIVCASSSHDHLLPTTASRVQAMLGATRARAFDINSGCSGFIVGLSVARSMVASGSAENVAVIASEGMTRLLDWDDRNTCVLFGDGAGAAIVSAGNGPGQINGQAWHTDGTGAMDITIGTGAREGLPPFVSIRGQQVFRFAVGALSSTVNEIVSAANTSLDQVDLIVPHQANARIVEATARKLGLPIERFHMSLDRYANTAAASIPMAVVDAAAQGRIRDGDTVLLATFGAGLTWGGCLIENIRAPRLGLDAVRAVDEAAEELITEDLITDRLELTREARR